MRTKILIVRLKASIVKFNFVQYNKAKQNYKTCVSRFKMRFAAQGRRHY